MTCKLYISNGRTDTYIGTFQNKTKAAEYYEKIKADIKKLYGYNVKSVAVYVENKKGKGK